MSAARARPSAFSAAAPISIWVFPAALAHDACATRALVFAEQRAPAAQVHAAFVAALSRRYSKVRNVAAIAAEINH